MSKKPQPSKGILKTNKPPAPGKPSPSPMKHTPSKTHFDEKNIKETLHPAGKSYGHDKIDEPKTPYHEYQEDASTSSSIPRKTSVQLSQGTSGTSTLDSSLLSKMLSEKGGQPSKAVTDVKNAAEFEARRKAHYDEFKKKQEQGGETTTSPKPGGSAGNNKK